MKKTLITLALALVTTTATFAQVGIGTKTPAPSAVLELSTTTKGFLPPRMTTSERNDIASPAEGLTIFNTTLNCLQWFNGTGWFNACDGTLEGPPIAVGACAGEPSIFTFQGLNYRPVESAGACWLDRNLGASQVATQPRSAFADAAAYTASQSASFGDLYQWGRATEGHEKRTSPGINTIANTAVPNANNPWDGRYIVPSSGNNWLAPVDFTLWQGVNGTNNPCPANYRLPTESELNTEMNSWSPDFDNDGAFGSPLKLPVAGERSTLSSPFGGGDFAQYWSGEIRSDFPVYLFFNDGFSQVSTIFAREGISVRCIKN